MRGLQEAQSQMRRGNADMRALWSTRTAVSLFKERVDGIQPRREQRLGRGNHDARLATEDESHGIRQRQLALLLALSPLGISDSTIGGTSGVGAGLTNVTRGRMR